MTDEELLKMPLREMTVDILKMAIAAKDRKLAQIAKENKEYKMQIRAGLHVISDDLGVQGVLNHADGKVYDSKSSYYKAVEAKGKAIMEPGMEPKPKEIFNEKKFNEAYKKTMEQLNGRS